MLVSRVLMSAKFIENSVEETLADVDILPGPFSSSSGSGFMLDVLLALEDDIMLPAKKILELRETGGNFLACWELRRWASRVLILLLVKLLLFRDPTLCS